MSLDNELIKAVNSKNIKEVKSLLDKGEDPNVECDTWTPIHHAASSLREDIVELLIRYGANINGICNSSRIPLHTAICYPCTFGWSGNRDMARLLLKYGADVDAKDNYGLTPLLELLENEKYYRHRGESQNIRVEIIKLLLEKGANVDVKSKNGLTPLHYAANYDCTEIVELFLKSGVDVNAKSNDGLTPLLGLLKNLKHYSYRDDSQNIRVEIIKLLLKSGANVDVKSKNGLTPLHYAANYDCTEIVELLLKSGADVNAKSNDGLTPLLELLKNEKYYRHRGESQNIRVEIIKLLLKSGADVNAKSNDGLTPLLELLKNEKYYRHRGESQNIRVEIIKLLLKSGADVNAKSNDGLTPLHYAAKYDCTEIVELLLKSGADIDVKSKNGLTPLLGLLENVKYYSYMGDSQNIRVEIIKLLLEKGANVDVKSENGLTPLHYAAKYGYTEIVELFLKSGANVDVKSENGLTPLHYAAKYGYTEIVELFLKSGADVNAKDNYGLTPLLRLLENVKYYSYIGDSQNIRVEIIKLLLEKGADVNAKSNGGLTPLGRCLMAQGIFTLKAYPESFFLLLLFGADVNKESEFVRGKINNTHELKSCLTAFEEIEAMPNLSRLVKTYRNQDKKKNAKVIVSYINSKANGQELIEEFKTIKEKYSSDEQLSFVPKCILDFIEHLSKQYLSKHKKDAFKTGALTGIIEEVILEKQKKDISLMNDLEIKDYGVSDKDISNFRLVCTKANDNARACCKRYKVKPELLLTQLEEIEPSNKRQRLEV